MTKHRNQKKGSQKPVVVQQAMPQASPVPDSPEEASPVQASSATFRRSFDTGVQDSQQPMVQPATTQDSPRQASRANHRHSVDTEKGYLKYVANLGSSFFLNSGIVICAMILMSTHLAARIDGWGTRLDARIDVLSVTVGNIKTILDGYLSGHAKNLAKSSLELLVSPSKDGNDQGCGTMAYSNTL